MGRELTTVPTRCLRFAPSLNQLSGGEHGENCPNTVSAAVVEGFGCAHGLPFILILDDDPHLRIP